MNKDQLRSQTLPKNRRHLRDLMIFYCKIKICTHNKKYSVVLKRQNFHVFLLPNPLLTKQRPNVVSLPYQETQKQARILCKSGTLRENIIREMRSEFINSNI